MEKSFTIIIIIIIIIIIFIIKTKVVFETFRA